MAAYYSNYDDVSTNMSTIGIQIIGPCPYFHLGSLIHGLRVLDFQGP